MSFAADEFMKLYDTLIDDTADKIIPVFMYPFGSLCAKENLGVWEEIFMKPYNSYYGTAHTFNAIEHLPLFLLHTFIMPTWFFLHMMPFVESILPRLLKILNWDTRHLAGHLERIFALCISCGIVEGKFRSFVPLHGVSHIDAQHSVDELRGIGTKNT
jgi:hypothetical protein